MLSKPTAADLRTARAQPSSEEGRAEDLFNLQKAYFATDATKTYEWRIDQLNRLTRMLKENFQRFADASRKDFKPASQENAFEVSASIATSESAKSQLEEWMKPVEAPLRTRRPSHAARHGSYGYRGATRWSVCPSSVRTGAQGDRKWQRKIKPSCPAGNCWSAAR